METIGMFDARTNFSEYVRAVQEGREFLITSRGEEVAMLIPVKKKHTPESVERCLERLSAMHARPVLEKGETWRGLLREGARF